MSVSFLDKIRGVKVAEVEAAKRRGVPSASADDDRPSFYDALRRSDAMAVIAEIKRASPSAGAIEAALDAPEQALRYARGGAAAVSVLTERVHFKGSLDDLAQVSAALKTTPTLRKDFLLDPIQIDEAVLAGASAVLLIVAFLEPAQLAEMIAYARDRGIEALVEIHDEPEAEIALDAGARIVGVNARNLRTLEVDRDAVLRMGPHLDRVFAERDDLIFVAESGIRLPEHVQQAWSAGYRAVLVGEALVRHADPSLCIQQFSNAPHNANLRSEDQRGPLP